MNKLGIIAGLLFIANVCMAEPDAIPFTSSGVYSGATVTVSHALNGYVESIYIDVPLTGYTTTVTIASTHETILSATVTADTMFYPRRLLSYTDGVTTNTATQMTRIMVAGEPTTATITTSVTGLTQKTVSAIIKTNDK